MWDALISEAEAAFTESGVGALSDLGARVEPAIARAALPWLENVGVMLVGIAFFALGAGMIVFSTLEDAVRLIESGQSKVADVAGAAAKVGALIP